MPSAIKGSGKHWTFKKEKEKSGKQRWRDIYKSISRPYVVIFFKKNVTDIRRIHYTVTPQGIIR